MKLSFRYFLGIIFLFIQCASNPVSETLESWQIERDNKNYWYGVSIISKKPNIDNIQEVARNQAIAEIASQIKININQGNESATAWGCDMTEEYVIFNSAYST